MSSKLNKYQGDKKIESVFKNNLHQRKEVLRAARRGIANKKGVKNEKSLNETVPGQFLAALGILILFFWCNKFVSEKRLRASQKQLVISSTNVRAMANQQIRRRLYKTIAHDRCKIMYKQDAHVLAEMS